MRMNLKTLSIALLLFLLAGTFYYLRYKNTTRQLVATAALTTEFSLESFTLNGREVTADKLDAIVLPKSTTLAFQFRFRWLTENAPREFGSVKIIRVIEGRPVIVQSQTGNLVNRGKASTLAVQLQLPDDTSIGDAKISVQNLGKPFAEIPCKIVEKP